MRSIYLCLFVAACSSDPTAIDVELAPSIISSLDGTLGVAVLVHDDASPLDDQPVRITVDYTDRNGVAHAIDRVDGTTDTRGRFEASLVGFEWDGIGTVTVETAADVRATATFTVLDRTPPRVEILPPTTDKKVGPGLPLDVQVRVTDEIGVSEVVFDGDTLANGSRSTIVASGTQMTTLTFRTAVELNATSTIQLNAIAYDLSGNVGVASAMTLTVDPTITIATPPGLVATMLVDGTANQLGDPRALAVSLKDAHIYVADNSAGACNGACIWRVDATTGAIDATPVHVGQGDIEGVAFDATGDNLYFSDRSDRVGRLAWDGAAYTTPTACNDTTAQRPQDPYHLVFDATLGILPVDGNRRELARVDVCDATTVGTSITANQAFEAPRGIALGPTGELYVADQSADRISQVDRANGTLTTFANVDSPYGIEWVAGASAWANSLLVASTQDRVIASTKAGAAAAAFLRNTPIDVTIDGGTLYILTSPSANNRGRIYKVTGF